MRMQIVLFSARQGPCASTHHMRVPGALRGVCLFWRAAQNKTHALNNEIVVNALAGVIGVGITYIKDDEDILPLLKVGYFYCWLHPHATDHMHHHTHPHYNQLCFLHDMQPNPHKVIIRCHLDSHGSATEFTLVGRHYCLGHTAA